MRSSSAAASSAISPNASEPQIGDPPGVDLLAGRVALREPLDERERVVDAAREQVAVEHPGRRRELELAGCALARAAQVGSEHRPAARACAGDGRRRERVGLAALVERDQDAGSVVRPTRPGAGAPRRASRPRATSSASRWPKPSCERHVVRDDAAHAGRGDASARTAPAGRPRDGSRPSPQPRRARACDARRARGSCRRSRGSDSPGQAAGIAHVRLGEPRLGARDVVGHGVGVTPAAPRAPRRPARAGRSAAASAEAAASRIGGVQTVAAADLDEARRDRRRRAPRRRARPRATTARAPAIGNGGSSIACTTVTRLGRGGAEHEPHRGRGREPRHLVAEVDPAVPAGAEGRVAHLPERAC